MERGARAGAPSACTMTAWLAGSGGAAEDAGVGIRDRFMRQIAPLLWRAQVVRWQLLGGHVLGVKMILVDGEGVLLVRQTYRRGWFLPGGGVKRGEDLVTAAKREAREETGAITGEVEFLGMWTRPWKRVTNHIGVFVCRDFERRSAPDWEIAEVRAFPPDALPAGLDGGDRRVIERWRAGAAFGAGRW